MVAPLVKAAVALAGLLAVGRFAFPGALRLARSWPERVAVTGHSMAPRLLPGDWLLVDASGGTPRPVAGELVVVPDPRRSDRLLVKRVSAVERGQLLLRGDAPDASTDSRTFGAVDPGTVLGRPWFRYWPPRRIGRVG